MGNIYIYKKLTTSSAVEPEKAHIYYAIEYDSVDLINSVFGNYFVDNTLYTKNAGVLTKVDTPSNYFVFTDKDVYAIHEGVVKSLADNKVSLSNIHSADPIAISSNSEVSVHAGGIDIKGDTIGLNTTGYEDDSLDLHSYGTLSLQADSELELSGQSIALNGDITVNGQPLNSESDGVVLDLPEVNALGSNIISEDLMNQIIKAGGFKHNNASKMEYFVLYTKETLFSNTWSYTAIGYSEHEKAVIRLFGGEYIISFEDFNLKTRYPTIILDNSELSSEEFTKIINSPMVYMKYSDSTTIAIGYLTEITNNGHIYSVADNEVTEGPGLLSVYHDGDNYTFEFILRGEE